MAVVAISGLVTGYRLRTSKNENTYGVIDVLQVGDTNTDSSIVHVLVYDSEIQNYLHDNYLNGQIVPISMQCNIISQDRKSMMWICNRIYDFREDVRKEEEKKVKSSMAEILCFIDDLETFYKDAGKEDLYGSLLDFKARLVS